MSEQHHDIFKDGVEYPFSPAAGTELALVPDNKPVETRPLFTDFGGLDYEIERLKEVGTIFANPDVAEDWDVHIPTGILLYGPGGVGKTELIRAFSREIDARLVEVNISDIQSMWVGEPNDKLRKTFENAKQRRGRTVILFDEMDGLFSEGAGGNQGMSKALISEMKMLLSNLRAQQPNTIVAGSTNSLSGFDEALLRPGRFDVVLQIPKPDDAARAGIFGTFISDRPELYDLGSFNGVDQLSGSIDLQSLSAATEGMTGADIKSILHAARAKRVVAAIRQGTPLAELSQKDILESIKAHRQQRVGND